MSTAPRRIVVCEEPRREADLRPGPPMMPSPRFVDMARRFGEALELPYVAVGISLEQCDLTDFIFYLGSWEAFALATPDWPVGRRRLRAHRTAHMMGMPDGAYSAALEHQQLAFSIPFLSMTESPDASSELYARRDIAAAAGLPTFEVFRTEHYVSALSPPGMTQPEMVARYLRTYWDKLGY